MNCVELSLLLSLASYHVDDTNNVGYKYNQFNPGITARCQVDNILAFESGIYLNSIDQESIFIGTKLNYDKAHVITGVVTGYYSELLPYFGVGYEFGRLELLLIPGASFKDLATPTVLTFRVRIN